MKTLFILIAILSTSVFASCGSKVKTRIYKELQRDGHSVSINNIQVTHKARIAIDQGAFLKEMDTYEIEVLGTAMGKFSGLTSETGIGCRVENIQRTQQLRI